MNPDDPAREYVAFDLETTGLMAETDRIVEIGAIRFGPTGQELGRFEVLVNPQRAMSPAAQRIHGISDHDLAGAENAQTVLPRFLTFLGDPRTTRLVAHNAAFDAGFLGRELGRLGVDPRGFKVFDTLALARTVVPEASDHRLETLSRMFALDDSRQHRALADSLRVKGLWLALRGPIIPEESLVRYPVRDHRGPAPVPDGWDRLSEAASAGLRVRMEYAGGSRGPTPRDVTPRGFAHRGGVAYLVAFCHIDSFEKSFRLDRVQRYEIVSEPTESEPPTVSKG